MKKKKKKDAAWMDRMATHNALTHFYNFLVCSDNKTKCAGLRIKSGEDIMDGDPELKEIIGPAFNNLQDACFYDFGKDMAGEWKPQPKTSTLTPGEITEIKKKKEEKESAERISLETCLQERKEFVITLKEAIDDADNEICSYKKAMDSVLTIANSMLLGANEELKKLEQKSIGETS